ncbi:MAG: T9SS type A sorting domain-containing protein [Saprospiraceae bacterium]|nr:T9SS type A sorting domain-containing protein [Saprospiraceae bacterium]
MKKKISLLALIIFSLQIAISTAQTISTISPTSGNRGQTLTVTVSGQNTHFAQGSGTIVWFSQGSQTMYPNTMVPTSNTSMVTNLSIPNNATLGQWNVNAFNTTDGNMTKYSAFTVNINPNPPQIISITPDSGLVGNNLSVTITGQNTNFQQGTMTYAWINQGSSTMIQLSSINVSSNTVLSGQLSIPSNSPLGLYDAGVYNSFDGSLSKPSCFTVYQMPNQPTLVSLTPNSAIINQTNNYTLIGQNTHFTDPTLNIFFENFVSIITNVTNVNVVSDTEVKFDANFSISSSWDLHAQSTVDGNLFMGSSVTVTTGIEEYENNPYNLKTYPNPFSDNIIVSGENFNQNTVKIKVLNPIGQIVFSSTESASGTLNKKISLSNLESGVYFIRLETEEYSVTKKVVKY